MCNARDFNPYFCSLIMSSLTLAPGTRVGFQISHDAEGLRRTVGIVVLTEGTQVLTAVLPSAAPETAPRLHVEGYPHEIALIFVPSSGCQSIDQSQYSQVVGLPLEGFSTRLVARTLASRPAESVAT